MAEAVPFKEQNTTCGIGQNDPNRVYELPAWSGTDQQGTPLIISCWRFTTDELAEIARTGCVWQGICGTRLPPSWIAARSPFAATGPGECAKCGKPVHDDRAGQVCLTCQAGGDLPQDPRSLPPGEHAFLFEWTEGVDEGVRQVCLIVVYTEEQQKFLRRHGHVEFWGNEVGCTIESFSKQSPKCKLIRKVGLE